MPINPDDPIYQEIVKGRLNEQTDVRGQVKNLLAEKRALEDREQTLSQALGVLDATTGDYAENSLKMHAFIMSQVKTIAQSKGKNYGKIAQDMAKVWPRLNVARVFAIPEMAYVAVHGWADHHTTEVVAKLPFSFKKPGSNPPEHEVQDYMSTIREASVGQPLPEHLPFDQTLMVYGGGVPLSHANALAAIGPEADRYPHLRLLADLVSVDGTVWEFCLGIADDGNLGFFAQSLRDAPNGWSTGLHLAPWVVPGVVDLINSFKTLVHEQPRGLGFRKKWEKYQKEAARLNRGLSHPIPPPFYKVELHQALVEDRVRERAKQMARIHRTWQLQHRCDVRSHERVRLARGKLPINPEVEQDLRERQYKLFTHNPVDDDTARLLMERHERGKGHDEWLAVKVSWVKAHQRGPEDGPYVPALRVVPSPA